MSTSCQASDLAIAGFVPLSTVDWPGNLAATVFLQGCPWRCPYCQNAAILDPRTPGIVAWKDVKDFLAARTGLLDGVIFSGGEALRQAALLPAIDEVHNLALEVGLHTAGPYPHRFAQTLPHLAWVGLDIKALPEGYKEAAGFAAGEKGWESLRLLLEEYRGRGHSGFSYEVRLTVFPGSPASRHFGELITELRREGVEFLALQEARTQGTDEIFLAMSRRWDMGVWRTQWKEMVELAGQAGFAQLSVREAH